MNNKVTYIFLTGMGLLLVFLIVFIVNSISKVPKDANILDQSKLLSKNESIFDSKKEAYDKMEQDSINSIREDNINVDFGSLFGSSVDTAKKKSTQGPNLDTTNTDKSKKTKEPVKETIKSNSESNKKVVVPIHKTEEVNFQKFSNKEDTTKKTPPTNRTRNGFYSSTVENNNQKVNSNQNTINTVSASAVIHSQQEVYPGSTIKLRTVAAFTFNKQNIPANTFLYGITSIKEERVYILISSINLNGKIIPVALSVFDQDGQEGIHIPGLVQHEMTREAIKNTTDNVNANVNINVPVVGNIATIPINVAKRKQNLPSAIITQGYQIILKSK